jgi:hypothetical protein
MLPLKLSSAKDAIASRFAMATDAPIIKTVGISQDYIKTPESNPSSHCTEARSQLKLTCPIPNLAA